MMVGWCVLAASAHACDVPVFRYALERWQSAPYRCFIFHQGPLSEDSQQALGYLRAEATAGEGRLNVELQIIDVSGEIVLPAADIWREVKDCELPLLVVAYPTGQLVRGIVWSETLNMSTAKSIVDSPAGKEIARRLLAGQAAVWVLVASGDEGKDLAAERLLATQLSTIGGELELPGDGFEESDAEGQTDSAKIEFSTMRLARSDPSEQLLIKTLLASEPDLESTYAAEPVVFPVFGRARALYALVGKGINRVNVLEACQFLVGPCACDSDPGFPLPVKADWQQAVTGLVDEQVDLPAVVGSQEQSYQDGAGSVAQANDSSSGALSRNVLVALALVMAGVLLIILVLRRRSPRS